MNQDCAFIKLYLPMQLFPMSAVSINTKKMFNVFRKIYFDWFSKQLRILRLLLKGLLGHINLYYISIFYSFYVQNVKHGCYQQQRKWLDDALSETINQLIKVFLVTCQSVHSNLLEDLVASVASY